MVESDAVAFYVANGLGDSIDSPTPAQMEQFIAEIDADDREHGAAWLTLDDGWSLEWNGDGRLLLSPPDDPVRHLAGISRDRAVELWMLLVEGRLDALLAEPWQPGNGYVLTPERAEEMRLAHEHQDRKFYELLGEERADVRCKTEGCTRGAITLSVLCRPHHFEMICKRPCPFAD